MLELVVFVPFFHKVVTTISKLITNISVCFKTRFYPTPYFQSIQDMGNTRARRLYEANLPDSFRRPQTDQYPLLWTGTNLAAFIVDLWTHGLFCFLTLPSEQLNISSGINMRRRNITTRMRSMGAVYVRIQTLLCKTNMKQVFTPFLSVLSAKRQKRRQGAGESEQGVVLHQGKSHFHTAALINEHLRVIFCCALSLRRCF